MGTQSGARTRGENTTVNIYLLTGGSGLQEFDCIDSINATNNSTLQTTQALGESRKTHDVCYGDFTIELKVGKDGKKATRFFKTLEARELQGLESYKGYIVEQIVDRQTGSLEIKTYKNCVFQLKTTGVGGPQEEYSQSVTATSNERVWTQI